MIHLQRRTRFAFLWIALVPVILTIVAIWLGSQFQNEVNWITHTYEVRTAIRETVLLVWNAERDLRNYLLTGEEPYLRTMETGRAQALDRLEQLRALSLDNPVQQRNLQRFKPLIDSKIAELRRTLEIRNSQGLNAALNAVEIDRSQRLTEQIRDLSREMMEEEERQLLVRSQTELRISRQTELIFASAIALTLALLLWSGRLLKNYAAQRDTAELALKHKVSEIETLNRELESRVQERTAELRLLAAIVESSDDAMLGVSIDGAIQSWNAGAERLYGYTAAEIIGRNVRVLVPPDRQQEETAILEKLRAGDRVSHFETVRLRKDGTLVDVSLTVSPIHDPAGRTIGASGVARDITEQKRNAENMRQAQKLESLGVLAGGIAHDFNNLLVGILGNASMALDYLPADSPARLPIEAVASAGERAADLTRQMLAYSGRGHFVLERIDLSMYVRQTVPLIQAAIPRTVELRLELDHDLPAIEADAAQIQQLLMNLVINGAEAIPEGKPGTVTIVTRRDQQHVVLEIRDTGSGMDESTKARIFDPFFTTKFTGRGLGLAAVLGIVRGHAGDIQVSSAPGQGTAFSVLFPALAQPAAPEPKPAPCPRNLANQGTILVVDDEPIVRSVARGTLERYGYTVLLAEDGAQALEIVRSEGDRIRGVLLDLTMPVMSGEDALARIKELRPDLPVILTSGFNEAEALRRFEGKGLAGFIQKPYRASTLAEKVQDALGAITTG